MIAYIKGKFTHKTPTQVFVELSNGLAYDVQISLQTYSRIETLEEGKLYTALIIRDDAHLLYGFADVHEKELFLLLISVSGIGTNTARIILSSLSPDEIKQAIVTDDDMTFKKVKGVGPKTAKRIILDLKDKIKDVYTEDEIPQSRKPQNQNQEALNALLALGFQKHKIQKALSKIDTNQSLEVLIKDALKILT